MHLFYTPTINADIFTLNEEESKHCNRVLRLTAGDLIYLVDGVGGFFETKIIEAHPKRCTVQVLEVTREHEKRSNYLHVAIAPTKNIERLEWFLEKATEIGIDEITPILCDHSERKDIKVERLNKIIESAMKQSLKAYHPVLHELTPFAKFITQPFAAGMAKHIAYCGEATKQSFALQIKQQPLSNLILIGPEGDFSPKEILAATAQQFQVVTLGNARLRTETAALAATVIANNY